MVNYTIRRGPGRPRKIAISNDGPAGGNGLDSGSDPGAIDPDNAGASADTGADTGADAPNRRGRTPGVKTKAKSPPVLNVSGVEQTLLSLHLMAASYFKQPALALEVGEAKAIAQALAEVSKYYNVPGLNPKHAAILSLALVLMVTYGKRVPYLLDGRKQRPSAAPVTPPGQGGGTMTPPDFVTPDTKAFFTPPPVKPN